MINCGNLILINIGKALNLDDPDKIGIKCLEIANKKDSECTTDELYIKTLLRTLHENYDLYVKMWFPSELFIAIQRAYHQKRKG